MDTKLYICRYCFEEFKPRRRHVQKYCSNSCRSKAHHFRNKKAGLNISGEVSKQEVVAETGPNKIEGMSLPGIGNSFVANAAYKLAENVFTAQMNKPATKGDIKEIIRRMDRYHKITNLPLREDGFVPLYDIDTQQIVYLPPFKRFKS